MAAGVTYRRRPPAWALALLALALQGLLAGCSSEPARPAPPSFLVFAIDGAEWEVIRQLWSEGRLPNLKRLSDGGVSGELATDYGASPIIWTSVATGMVPEKHGITGFVVPTDRGDVPVSSSLRKAAALWEMTSQTNRRTVVLNWWASWPAEPVHGVMITDRALLDVADRVFPEEYLPRLESTVATATAAIPDFDRLDAPRQRDEVTWRSAAELADKGFDLMLVYFRHVDSESHTYWGAYRADEFDSLDPDYVERFANRVPDAYERVDRAIGEVLRAAGPDRNVLVISDHGFHAQNPPRLRVSMQLDRVFERLGYLAHEGRAVDMARTEVYAYGTAKFRAARLVRFSLAGREPGGRLQQAELAGVRRRLEADLSRLRFENGEPAFTVRDASEREVAEGGDFVVQVHTDKATPAVLFGEQLWDDVVGEIVRVTGTHGPRTAGIFIAAGPLVDASADIEGINIHDITPTVLYGMGLPLADDFDGEARLGLYQEAYRERTPVRRVASWGAARRTSTTESAVDEALVEELRALGYLD